MTLMEQVTDCLAAAVENHEAAGLSVMVRRCGTEVLYTQAGMADAQAGRPSAGTAFSGCTASRSRSRRRR